jgi:hypothetical protein
MLTVLIIGVCNLSRVYQLNIRSSPYATNVSAYFIVHSLHYMFGPDQWPSSDDMQHKIYLKTVNNISTDPLSQIYKRAKAVVTLSLKHVVV